MWCLVLWKSFRCSIGFSQRTRFYKGLQGDFSLHKLILVIIFRFNSQGLTEAHCNSDEKLGNSKSRNSRKAQVTLWLVTCYYIPLIYFTIDHSKYRRRAHFILRITDFGVFLRVYASKCFKFLHFIYVKNVYSIHFSSWWLHYRSILKCIAAFLCCL